MDKIIDYKGKVIVLENFDIIIFEIEFYEWLYRVIYIVVIGFDYRLYVDVDVLVDGSLGIDVVVFVEVLEIKLKKKFLVKVSNSD